MPEVYPEPQSISHQELFLFQFANSHCVKGILSCYRPEKELNRTPTREPEVNPILDEIDKSNRSITKNGVIYNIVDGEPICIGTTFFNHELFNKFCHQHDIEGVSNDQGLVLWEHCQQVLRAVADNDPCKIQFWKRYCKEVWETMVGATGETFGFKIYASLLELLEIRVQEIPVRLGDTKGSILLHFLDKGNFTSLKQCACCGCFWIEPQKGKQGKPKSVFCGKKCSAFFSQASREKNKQSVKTTKEFVKKIQAKKDCKRISEIYQHNGYDEAYAEQRAEQWVYKQGKSLKEFRRRETSYKGEGLDLSGF